MIAKGEFVKMSWDTVANFVSYSLAHILELNYPCTAHSDASDYWAIQLEDRMSLDKLEKICSYIEIVDVLACYPTQRRPKKGERHWIEDKIVFHRENIIHLPPSPDLPF